jgi:hypothetical protein
MMDYIRNYIMGLAKGRKRVLFPKWGGKRPE